MKTAENTCVFLSGGIIYSLIEIAWRGYTHWTMTAAGGVCLLLIHFTSGRMRGKKLLLKCIASAGIITSVEFAAGVVVNMIFKLHVWDYSARPGNILGQICPLFTFLWFLLSVPAVYFSALLDKFFLFLKKREEQDGNGRKVLQKEQ